MSGLEGTEYAGQKSLLVQARDLSASISKQRHVEDLKKLKNLDTAGEFIISAGKLGRL